MTTSRPGGEGRGRRHQARAQTEDRHQGGNRAGARSEEHAHYIGPEPVARKPTAVSSYVRRPRESAGPGHPVVPARVERTGCAKMRPVATHPGADPHERPPSHTGPGDFAAPASADPVWPLFQCPASPPAAAVGVRIRPDVRPASNGGLTARSIRCSAAVRSRSGADGLVVDLVLARPTPLECVVTPHLTSAASTIAAWMGRPAIHRRHVPSRGPVWVVLGDKGRGKSTTLGWLAKVGVPIVTEDLVICDGGDVLAGRVAWTCPRARVRDERGPRAWRRGRRERAGRRPRLSAELSAARLDLPGTGPAGRGPAAESRRAHVPPGPTPGNCRPMGRTGCAARPRCASGVHVVPPERAAQRRAGNRYASRPNRRRIGDRGVRPTAQRGAGDIRPPKAYDGTGRHDASASEQPLNWLRAVVRRGRSGEPGRPLDPPGWRRTAGGVRVTGPRAGGRTRNSSDGGHRRGRSPAGSPVCAALAHRPGGPQSVDAARHAPGALADHASVADGHRTAA